MTPREAIIVATIMQRGHPLEHTDAEIADAVLECLSGAGWDLVRRGHWIAFQPDTGGCSTTMRQATGED